ncbi:VOC family protein [Streptomyces sp. NPDC018045]|uniref:VOC family protein n=1 Tax=Streptomyces sp. NPDC018045 TaxID=3365037 RepID=UPI0037939F49
MIIRLDHVGVATDDPVAAGRLLSDLGLAKSDAGTAEAYGVSCDFWAPGGDGAAVELVAPLCATAAVQGHLDRHGPGPYHIAFEVDDVQSELDRLRAAGLVPVDTEPKDGARPGMRVAFVYARRPAGLLIELVQYDRAERPA